MNKQGRYQKTAREAHRDSADIISNALEHFGMAKADGSYEIPAESTIEHMASLISEVVRLQQGVEVNDYTRTTLAIANWLANALNYNYIEQNNRPSFPSILYIIRKALEVLHCLLHRDLRRRQLSQTEGQIVQEFVKLASQYPDPQGTSQTGRTTPNRKSS